MIRTPLYTLLALAVFGMSGLTAQADETKSSAPTEQAEKATTKKEKIKERRAARKQKRVEKKQAKKATKAAQAAPVTAPQTAAADEPAERPNSNTPIVIAPPKPPTPAPVFSES